MTKIVSRSAGVVVGLLLISFSCFGQQPTCSYTSNARLVHQEGLAERIGDVVVTCTGGTVGSIVSLQLFVGLNANITNRLDSNGQPTGISLTGATVGSFAQTSATLLTFSAVNYTATAAPTVLTISGIRVAVASLSNGSAPATVTASIVGSGAQFPNNNLQVIAAISQPTLLGSLINNGVPCAGSPLPSTLDFPSFSSTSFASTVRVTEAAMSSFSSKDAGADSGTRILLNISGYGPNARVFVPDAIVGNSGSSPTSTGAYASPIAPGTYTPGAGGQLLLIRVNGADSSGAGGQLAMGQPAATTTFGSMTEVPLTGGAGFAVYEVVDANDAFQESAQIPAFVVAQQTSCPTSLTPTIGIKLAPVSTVSTATQTDPIPRFVSVNPMLDCSVRSDCSAFFFPQFTVDTTPINVSGASLGGVQSAFVKVGNMGPGILNFTTSITYGAGAAGWLSLSPSSGFNNATIQVIASPLNLAPGTYTANITVSAAPYGMGTIPVTFTVGPVGVTIQNVGNAFSFTYGRVAPGSYAVIFGLNLQGANVTFNGVPAQVIYNSATQLNVIVPATLGTQQNAAVVATVTGMPSNSFVVGLALNAPGVFPTAVNSDGSLNSAAHPAKRGDFVSFYLTGLAIVGGNTTGTVTMNFGSLINQPVIFAGPQGAPALDQVNVTVPTALPASPNPVQSQICIPGSDGQPVCSNQVPLYIQ